MCTSKTYFTFFYFSYFLNFTLQCFDAVCMTMNWMATISGIWGPGRIRSNSRKNWSVKQKLKLVVWHVDGVVNNVVTVNTLNPVQHATRNYLQQSYMTTAIKVARKWAAPRPWCLSSGTCSVSKRLIPLTGLIPSTGRYAVIGCKLQGHRIILYTHNPTLTRATRFAQF